MKPERRAFVSGGGFALAAVATGTITGLNPSGALGAASGNPRIASFGWELTNLNNNGADVYFEVLSNMTLNSLNIDTAFMITSTPATPGFAEVLCRAAFSNGIPKFVQGDLGAPFISPPSPDFGQVQVYNPNNFNVTGALNVVLDGVVLQNIFYSAILKTWVPADGTASGTSRHVAVAPSWKLTAGDYLVFHMNHAGTPGDCEMQVVLQYTVT